MTSCDRRTYELRIAGHLDDLWSSWLGAFTIARHEDRTCTLTGPVADQSELHGVLARLRDLGATLLSLRLLDEDGTENGTPNGGAAAQSQA